MCIKEPQTLLLGETVNFLAKKFNNEEMEPKKLFNLMNSLIESKSGYEYYCDDLDEAIKNKGITFDDFDKIIQDYKNTKREKIEDYNKLLEDFPFFDKIDIGRAYNDLNLLHPSDMILEEVASIIEKISNGKKEFDDKDDSDKTHTITKSTTDPEAGEFHKGEHEKMFAYSVHTVCDKNGFVLDFNVTPANVHDSTEFSNLYQKILSKFNFKYIALDAGYKTPAIAKEIIDSGKIPLMPYKRPNGKKNTSLKFTYDKYYDTYTCPNGNLLEYATTNRLGYREYTSNAEMCKNCPNLKECITSSQTKKAVRRHLWQDYLDKAEGIRHTPEWKKLYPNRSETIERVFGDAKEKHVMRYTQYRGNKKVTLQVLLTFLSMNLKKMAKWSWKKTKKVLTKIQKLLKIEYCTKIDLKIA